ncbi:hypothetical protein B484DRAFT_454556 [Ochromonadaceae sp. CCMP2298]|nr:hypothetical protein B484DRAFT_454556 [Ochromonadaceae sp. CCMP2298]|mmetsp:Transcript_21200/g.47074  ORF Transcript_21200/g.47074 Transcript_21200/m.47074 type:complete len:330 (-) Transcript_21200:68-1057(-)
MRSKRSTSSATGSGRESTKQRKIADFWAGNGKKRGEEKPTETLSCPICSITLWHDNALNNLHIDGCLARGERAAESARQEKEHLTVLSHAPGNFKLSAVENLTGLFLIEDFISEKEEQEITQLLDADAQTPWKHSSFNGDCFSKCFGVRTQFGLPDELRLVRQNEVSRGECNMPTQLDAFPERLQSIVALHGSRLPNELRDFKPNECNANSYYRSQGHCLKPHFDDRTLSGPILMNLSLGGCARMTYSNPSSGAIAAVPLPRRCLQLVTGPARWSYMHEIKQEDVLEERRVSITWRQSGGKKGILLSEAKEDVGSMLLRTVGQTEPAER